MIQNRRNFALMAALGAALSSGAGAALATPAPADAPEFPNDGKIRIRHTTTGQVNEFDTVEQADNFGRNVENVGEWELVKPHAADAPITGLVPNGDNPDFNPEKGAAALAGTDAPGADAETTTTEKPAI